MRNNIKYTHFDVKWTAYSKKGFHWTTGFFCKLLLNGASFDTKMLHSISFSESLIIKVFIFAKRSPFKKVCTKVVNLISDLGLTFKLTYPLCYTNLLCVIYSANTLQTFTLCFSFLRQSLEYHYRRKLSMYEALISNFDQQINALHS